ncbi:MAG: hypothetical protein WCD70_12645 [Alphaproteobacteria bacterium]
MKKSLLSQKTKAKTYNIEAPNKPLTAKPVPVRGQKAYDDLTAFENGIMPHDEKTIEMVIARLRKQFTSYGVAMTQELDSQIKSAAARRNKISAEDKLDRLKKTKGRYPVEIIKHFEKALRAQFVAGGIALTDKGLLPDRLETSLTAMTARLLTLSKS